MEGYLKRLTQVKQFKGNATKLSVCKLLTHWECGERNKSRNKEFSLLLFWHFTFLKKVVILTDLRQGIFTKIKCQEL